jgi:hypothetical protein
MVERMRSSVEMLERPETKLFPWAQRVQKEIAGSFRKKQKQGEAFLALQ